MKITVALAHNKPQFVAPYAIHIDTENPSKENFNLAESALQACFDVLSYTTMIFCGKLRNAAECGYSYADYSFYPGTVITLSYKNDNVSLVYGERSIRWKINEKEFYTDAFGDFRYSDQYGTDIKNNDVKVNIIVAIIARAAELYRFINDKFLVLNFDTKHYSGSDKVSKPFTEIVNLMNESDYMQNFDKLLDFCKEHTVIALNTHKVPPMLASPEAAKHSPYTILSFIDSENDYDDISKESLPRDIQHAITEMIQNQLELNNGDIEGLPTGVLGAFRFNPRTRKLEQLTPEELEEAKQKLNINPDELFEVTENMFREYQEEQEEDEDDED